MLKAIQEMQPAAVVVDSIQTVYTEQLTSAPGSISQVQEVAGATHVLCQAKQYAGVYHRPCDQGWGDCRTAICWNISSIPSCILKGIRATAYRILRAVKNRFGSTNEIGVFEMKDAGLEEVGNPSELFLAERPQQSHRLSGGRRAWKEAARFWSSCKRWFLRRRIPCRSAWPTAWNRTGCHCCIAVMEKRLGLHLSGQDVYVNVVGGIRIDEPAIDLGIVAAVTSSLRESPIDHYTMVIGEVGLGGEVRAVRQADVRIREAAKMGFRRCLLPERNLTKLDPVEGIELIGIREVGEALDAVLA